MNKPQGIIATWWPQAPGKFGISVWTGFERGQEPDGYRWQIGRDEGTDRVKIWMVSEKHTDEQVYAFVYADEQDKTIYDLIKRGKLYARVAYYHEGHLTEYCDWRQVKIEEGIGEL